MLMFAADKIVVVVEFVIVPVGLYLFDDDVVEYHWMVMNDAPTYNHYTPACLQLLHTWTSSVINLFEEDFFIVSSEFCWERTDNWWHILW